MDNAIDALVWIDVETTGLDLEHDLILEIAAIITDLDLNEISFFHRVIQHPENVLATMDPWCRNVHGQNGLVNACRASTEGQAQVEQELTDWLRRQIGKQRSPLCGNSPHFDRAFLRRLMPNVEQHLHFRCIDVSTMRQLAGLWWPSARNGLSKKLAHRALDDIRESVAELRYLRMRLGEVACTGCA